MSHFSFHVADTGGAPEPVPQPRHAEPGRWPRFESALEAVNRDVAATLPGQEPLVLMLSPSWPGEELPEQLHVAMADGSWQGNAVFPRGEDDEDPAQRQDGSGVLAIVADAAQETVVEMLWQAWPVCPSHRIGMHPRPAGTTAEWAGGVEEVSGPVVWWCRGGRGGDWHDVSEVGKLAGALPGKQRRSDRRSNRTR